MIEDTSLLDRVLVTARQVGGIRHAPAGESSIADITLRDLGIDSLNLVQFVGELETVLGLTFDDRDLSSEAFATVGTTVSFVSSQIDRAKRERSSERSP